MTFTIYKQTYYPFPCEEDEDEVYNTIEAESFQEAKNQLKQGSDIFSTIPDISEDTDERLEFKINRPRYSNCTFYMNNNKLYKLQWNEDRGYFIYNPIMFAGIQVIDKSIIEKYNLKLGMKLTQEMVDEDYHLSIQ